MIDVLLTADIEFDINGALTFPESATPLGNESVYRRSGGRDQGLGFILETLGKHGLPGTFFLETLSARHFGQGQLTSIAEDILRPGYHELGLHLHPEWRYFAGDDWRRSLSVARASGWRPNGVLAECTEPEFASLLEEAFDNFVLASGRTPATFRSGSLSAASFMYPLLAQCHFRVSSNVGLAVNRPLEAALHANHGSISVGGVHEFPVTSFSDLQFGAWNHMRLLTIIGCTFAEMRRVLERAARAGVGPIMLLTHASEFSTMVPNVGGATFKANQVTMRRLEDLCRYLAGNREHYKVSTLSDCAAVTPIGPVSAPEAPLHIGPWSLPRRWLESVGLARA